jgi:hypothetical protein
MLTTSVDKVKAIGCRVESKYRQVVLLNKEIKVEHVVIWINTYHIQPLKDEEEFCFNDTIEGPSAPAVKPGRVTQA